MVMVVSLPMKSLLFPCADTLLIPTIPVAKIAIIVAVPRNILIIIFHET